MKMIMLVMMMMLVVDHCKGVVNHIVHYTGILLLTNIKVSSYTVIAEEMPVICASQYSVDESTSCHKYILKKFPNDDSSAVHKSQQQVGLEEETEVEEENKTIAVISR